jgi:hypothetical protein
LSARRRISSLGPGHDHEEEGGYGGGYDGGYDGGYGGGYDGG